MPQEHRKYLLYNSDDFSQWANSIGKSTFKVVDIFLTSGKEPEQGFKACASLTKLGDKYGSAALEKACEQVLQYAKVPTVRNITAAIKGLRNITSKDSAKPKVGENRFGITRGAAYFAGKEVADHE